MPSKSAKEAAEAQVEPDMTPMIDVTFLILIFFLVTIKFKTLDAKLHIEMPTSFGSQNTGEVEKPKLAIDLEVVEPGMAIVQKGSTRGNTVARFLEPADFQDPPIIVSWLRGTKLETRGDAMSRAINAGWNTPQRPPELERRPVGTGWDFDKWAWAYMKKVFTGIRSDNTMEYTADRYPLRLIRYKVREMEPGTPDREIAVCYNIEELHRVMSELFWKYYKKEVDATLRDRSTGNPPDPVTEKERFAEYKRKSPALVIKSGESTVLAWAIATVELPTALRADKRRALRYKPRFVPWDLADLTCIDTGSAISQELVGFPRRIAPFYDSMGWNVQYEDITEVLDMLHDNVLSRNEVQNKNPAPWNGDGSWPKDEKYIFNSVMLEQTFAGDSSIGFIPEKFTGPNYRQDLQPYTLGRPKR
ncbi:MAG: biopolymer transporter ExbD [Planctomycetes bacterium]|nr:biopolymer transporter ExbD [Planctomycetota bacterium]